MKFTDELGAICTLIAYWHLFNGLKNYYTNFLLYPEQLENGPELEFLDFKNGADAELELDDDSPWELDSSVIDLLNLPCEEPTTKEGLWYLNDTVELGYLFLCASKLTSYGAKTKLNCRAPEDCSVWWAIGGLLLW